jgi:TRAP-type mannitol/chloroaromatic compound transport system substrate-binding protein
MSKKIKSLVFLGLALVLTFSLVAVACAPKAPVGEVVPKEQLTKAQADLAAEKQKTAAAEKKTKDLEAQLAAGQKPAEVYRWEPATWISSGPTYDYLVYFSEYVNKSSDGRIVSTPSAAGGVCPVDQQAEAAGSGLTSAMAPAGTYYGGRIPMTGIYGAGIGLPNYHDFVSCYETFDDGRAEQLLFGEYEKVFNVVAAGDFKGPQNVIMGSTVPIDTIDSLKGMKFRCGDEAIAGPLSEFGASTTWIPAGEVYTALATKVFDAFTMGSAADDYGLAFHEVTKYWLTSPLLMILHEEPFLVNRDVWNGMPEDLQELVKVACDAADYRGQLGCEKLINEAWEAVIAYGIIPVTWSAADAQKWVEAQFKWAKSYEDKDPNSAELMNIIREYRKFVGYD